MGTIIVGVGVATINVVVGVGTTIVGVGVGPVVVGVGVGVGICGDVGIGVLVGAGPPEQIILKDPSFQKCILLTLQNLLDCGYIDCKTESGKLLSKYGRYLESDCHIKFHINAGPL